MHGTGVLLNYLIPVIFFFTGVIGGCLWFATVVTVFAAVDKWSKLSMRLNMESVSVC